MGDATMMISLDLNSMSTSRCTLCSVPAASLMRSLLVNCEKGMSLARAIQ